MSLPKTIPYYIDVTIFRECEDLHFDILNQKRTFEIEAISNTSFNKEGGFCRMKSQGTIPSVPGSMHIGLGKNFEQNGQHKHQHITLYNKNLSHRINQFRFGELELDSPLHQTSLMLQKQVLYMLTYQVKLVPVIENEKIGFQLLADLTKTNIDKIRSNGIPAILFEWDFSPLQLTKTTEKTPLIILISHLLGVFGSFFMFVRWFDSLVFGSNTFKYVKL
ncbi:hypothetical protein TVAG_482190 [Trichomonas vaginalis G3]|uniref:Endoplasmic reticulum vesicle transporter C-terminal domain-containing protein n=1 Tax=Trichomonas vaginalis (strain ATCC PRA-98 / G3) TaxID=412133 RepID=A2EBM8_TRIV3|nr:vesicle-mediated transport [Trichomonas vaginalis G3]EAY09945.1 hypothetical protein TVAG_482190 [Trichomonas vaginalis G3]KAI5523086.1 vesicle-mediated transport [Trichomonas vaginalis G3]|eukprot:XP_001322168.1 hypothetical protein [Trichomonas vaginalis G3]